MRRQFGSGSKLDFAHPCAASSSRPALSESVTKLATQHAGWHKSCTSREAAAKEARHGSAGKPQVEVDRVRISGRHAFRDNLFTSGLNTRPVRHKRPELIHCCNRTEFDHRDRIELPQHSNCKGTLGVVGKPVGGGVGARRSYQKEPLALPCGS